VSTNQGTRRPPRALAFANRGLERALRRGRGPRILRLLTVRGRRTGRPHTTPIVPVANDDGGIWLVSAYGETAWVRNTRAAGQLELSRGDEHTVYDAAELEGPDAAPVLRTYLAMPTSLFVRRHFDVTASSSDEAIAAEAARHPTFALTPAVSP
jgi:deazaflavin-dependent oxidoreductase (nitroreductase family)